MLYTRARSMETAMLGQSAVRGVFYSQWAYWISLGIAAYGGVFVPRGSVRDVLILTPVLTELFCVLSTYWLYRACDEYLRLRLLKAAAVTGIVIAFSTLAGSFLPLFGLPSVSMVWINLLGWTIFNLQLLYVVLRGQ